MKKTYQKPALVLRDKLANITATPCIIVSFPTEGN